MVQRIVLIAALLGVCVVARAQDGPPYPGYLRDMDYGKVMGASGGAYMTRSGAGMTPRPGTTLLIGDSFSTGMDGKVALSYLTDGRLLLWPGTNFTFEFIGKVDRKGKGFDYKQTSGTIFNKVGGSYFGSTEEYVLVPGGTIAVTDAEFSSTVDPSGTLIAVRSGSLKVMGDGWTQTITQGKMFLIDPSGRPAAPQDISSPVNEMFLLAGQEMVMAGYGHNLDQSQDYFPSTLHQYTTKKAGDLTDLDKVPYFPAEGMGAARSPSNDYKKTVYDKTLSTDNLPPGESFEPDIWPGLYRESRGYMKRIDPGYPYPDGVMRKNPGPYEPGHTEAQSLRTAPPPGINVLTPRRETQGLVVGDYAGAYRVCQNYNATQSEIDDCVMQRLTPEARPGAIPFPRTPPELNLPMSHEPAMPSYVTLPPVDELPPPIIPDSSPSPLYCAFSIFRNPYLQHNDVGVDLLSQGRYAAALDTFEDALRINPDNPEILNNVAAVYYRLGDPGGGVRFIKQSIAQKPEDLAFHNTIACMYLQSGKQQQACNEWGFILSQENSNSQAQRNKSAFCP